MVVVLLVVVVMTALVGAIASDATNSIRQASDADAGAAAVAAAELAVADATARIELGAAVTFTGSVTVAGGGATYTATRVGDDDWDIVVVGSVDGVRRGISASLGRSARYPFALFVDERLETRNPVGIVSGDVGTNGTLDLVGLSPGTRQVLFQPAATCTGCTTPVSRTGPYELAEPTVPAVTRACPPGGVFTGAIDGAGGEPFLCADPLVPVVFESQSWVVNGPVEVFVGEGVPLTLDAAVVNLGGPPDQFRLYKLEPPTGTPAPVSAEGLSVSGLLYAPRSALTTGSLTAVGAVVLDRLTVTPGGTLSVVYSPQIAAIGASGWGLTRWSETGV